MPPKIHLYMTPGSVALASHITLAESGLPFSTTNLGAQRGFPAKHLPLNPKGRVPILDLDGNRITESPAIITTISLLVPEKKLLGTTVLEQARAHEWMVWLCATLHAQAFGGVFRPSRFVGAEEAVYDVVKAKARETVRECFEYIEGKLEGQTHAVGHVFTAVDVYLLVFYRWGNMLRFGMREHFPNYTRLVEEVVSRDAVKKTLEAEGLTPLND
ncbi:glutathione S-transferase [Ampelomyces quisqualis]|uniref:Glutathione S-transferase n=1 Tax=Ampelomyces quisqualis TaxID=50730 RepID=A0A6A5QLM2_AMPQU|nr:glutathione S-transferase [Ampelomyces quisqualis]